MDMLRQSFRTALETLDHVSAEMVLKQALAETAPLEMIERLVVPVMDQLGAEWDAGTLALSQIYMSSRMCEQLLGRFLQLETAKLRRSPRVAIVVLNDHHMLGKRIVHSVTRASGYDVLDYGRQDVDGLVGRVVADRLDILLVSVLMLPAALKVRDLRDALDARGAKVRIAVGGAPFLFDSELWREVGADAMGRTASDAVGIIERWTEVAA